MNIADYSAVIFDMDGLVLDTETTYLIAKQQAAQAMGYGMPERFWLAFSGMHQNDIEQKMLAHFGTDFNMPEFNTAAAQIWRDYVDVHGIKIKHGFLELLDFIVQQSLPYCLATNSNRVNANECLRLAGIQEIFPFIITRDDVQRGKPEPDIFLSAAQALNVDIKRCLVLEDSSTGIVAASRAGAFPVYVPSVLPMDSFTLSLCRVMRRDLEAVLESLRA